jgi:hypothetical protein
MLNVFEANLSFESGYENDVVIKDVTNEVEKEEWQAERKVKVNWDDKGELGDSCCFGTRTVEVGLDCVWKLHGGV